MSQVKTLGKIILVLLCLSSSAWAQATFGPEFNFSNWQIRNAQYGMPLIVNTPESEAARDKMMREVKKVCGDCTIQAYKNQYGVKTYRVSYPDGWWFDIATDPGVVEIQAKPSTTKQIKANLERIQKHIFDAAAAAGMEPMSHGSNIHVGLASGLGKGVSAVKILKNFMMDFSNHSELATGVWDNDPKNAPAFAKLPKQNREAFLQIAEDVDAGRITKLADFVQRVHNEVYNWNQYHVTPPEKYQAFNITRISNPDIDLAEQTFEIRAMAAQKTAEDYLLLTQLLEARLNYVKTQETVPFEVNPRDKHWKVGAQDYYKYVTETGLGFEPYLRFVALVYQENYLKEILARQPLTCNKALSP